MKYKILPFVVLFSLILSPKLVFAVVEEDTPPPTQKQDKTEAQIQNLKEKVETQSTKTLSEPTLIKDKTITDQTGVEATKEEKVKAMIKEKMEIAKLNKTNSLKFKEYKRLRNERYKNLLGRYSTLNGLKCNQNSMQYLALRSTLAQAKLNKAVEHQYFVLEKVGKYLEDISIGFPNATETVKKVESNLESVETNIEMLGTVFPETEDKIECNEADQEKIKSNLEISKNYITDSVALLQENQKLLLNLIKSIK